jgi:hypothetical protein
VLVIVHDTPSTSICQIYFCNKILRVQYGVLCMRISCILSMHNQYKGCSQGKNISVSSSHDACYIRLWAPINFCAVCCGLTRQYSQVVYNLHNLHVWATKDPHASHHSSFQQRININIWAGIIGDYVITPYII